MLLLSLCLRVHGVVVECRLYLAFTAFVFALLLALLPLLLSVAWLLFFFLPLMGNLCSSFLPVGDGPNLVRTGLVIRPFSGSTVTSSSNLT